MSLHKTKTVLVQSQVKEQKQLSRQKNIAAKTLINQLNTGEIE